MTIPLIVRRACVLIISVAALCCSSFGLAADDATPGAVTLSTEFPGGNIHLEANEGAVVRVAPDLRGDNPWFYWYFETVASKSGRVTFVFPEKVAGFKNGAIGFQGPAISLDRGVTWNWMGTDNIRENAFFYDFAQPGETVRFAVTIPYVQSDFDAFLKRHAENPHIKTGVLTNSLNGRPVELLQIGQTGPGVKPVLVTARHHAAESIASYVLEGLLDAAAAPTASGNRFREKYVLFCVPFVDKDGVEEGDQGKNRKPHDHNRDYGPQSIFPEVEAIKELDKTHNFAFSLDLHCPTLVMEDHQVMYFVGAKDHPEKNFDNVSEFAKRIKSGLPKEAPVGPLVWLRPAATPIPMNSHYFGFKPGIVMAATLEIPFAPKGRATDTSSCRRYGHIILDAWNETPFVPSESK